MVATSSQPDQEGVAGGAGWEGGPPLGGLSSGRTRLPKRDIGAAIVTVKEQP